MLRYMISFSVISDDYKLIRRKKKSNGAFFPTFGRFSMSAEQLSVAALVHVQDGHSDLGYFLPPPPRE